MSARRKALVLYVTPALNLRVQGRSQQRYFGEPFFPFPFLTFMQKSLLRTKLRQQRRGLSPALQKQAAAELSRRLLILPIIQRAHHIALYWPCDGEISPLPLLACLQRAGKRCYLPVIKKASTMSFVAVTAQSKFIKNSFGIPEPVNHRSFPSKQLDVVLKPLVGFDAVGHRLGMGGGYYDRNFAFKQRQHWSPKPYLLGVAHHCQQIDALDCEPWDIPMAAIMTDKQLLRINLGVYSR